jgi:TRAP-type C4-dicarboxylate transport system substrate-binding protein
VAERSGGRIRIDIAHSGATGDWPASIEALLIGTNDIVLQSIGTLDRYNTIAGIEAYPYLVRYLAHFRSVYHGPAGAALFDEIAAKTRFRIIGAGYRGARHLTSNRRVEKVEDLRGLKLRVPPLRMYRLTWELLGASPVPMGVAELFTSLQQGVVDGQENPLEVIESLKFNEVQRYRGPALRHRDRARHRGDDLDLLRGAVPLSARGDTGAPARGGREGDARRDRPHGGA